MASTVYASTVASQDVGPEDGKLLAQGASLSHGCNSNALPHPTLVAHRKRVAALLQVVWASGVICVCNASICFSLAALFVKLLGSAIPVFQIVAVRSVSSFLVCAAYARATHIKPFFGHRPNLRFLLARGIFGASAMTTYYFSLKMLPLADAVTIFFLNPAITAVAAWALMKEPLGLRGVGGVLVSMCGLVLLTRPPFIFGAQDDDGGGESASLHGDGGVGVSTAAAGGWDGQRLLGTLFGLLSAVLSTGAFISIRYIGKSEPALVVSVYFHMCAATSSLVPLAAGVPARAVWPSGVQWALLLGIAVCSFWGQIFIGRGFQLLNAARASAINLTQVVYSYILGLLFLHEKLTLLGGAGSVLIGAGAVLVNWKPKKPQQPPTAPPPVRQETQQDRGQQQDCSCESSGMAAPLPSNAADGPPGDRAVPGVATGPVELAVTYAGKDGGLGAAVVFEGKGAFPLKTEVPLATVSGVSPQVERRSPLAADDGAVVVVELPEWPGETKSGDCQQEIERQPLLQRQRDSYGGEQCSSGTLGPRSSAAAAQPYGLRSRPAEGATGGLAGSREQSWLLPGYPPAGTEEHRADERPLASPSASDWRPDRRQQQPAEALGAGRAGAEKLSQLLQPAELSRTSSVAEGTTAEGRDLRDAGPTGVDDLKNAAVGFETAKRRGPASVSLAATGDCQRGAG